MKPKTKITPIAVAALIFTVFYFFSRSSCAAGLVPCTNDCNLCYLLVGISNIFKWLMFSLLPIIPLLLITIAGTTYIVSGTFPKVLSIAKNFLPLALKGFILASACWLIINSVMNIVGYKHPTGGNWWEFECEAGPGEQAASTSNNNNNPSNTANNSSQPKACDPKNKKLESVKIQCAEKDFQLEGDGTGFYVVLDTLSKDEKGKTKQLKAVAKYSCDGTTSEEDVTSQAEWKASDETQIKVAKGVVQAVMESLGSSESIPYVEAKYQEKNSNQAKVYINSCPNTEIAEVDKNNQSPEFESLGIPKANAQENSNCKSCGQASTCHFVYGNENAKYMFILRRNHTWCFTSTVAITKEEWDSKSDSEYIMFKDAVNKLSKQIDDASGGSENFAVYRSDTIGGSQDDSCPTNERKFVSYGYFCKGKGRPNAVLDRKKALYFSNDFNSPHILAHEQIGHIFADLDDEYLENGKNPSDYGGKHYNCTKKEKVTSSSSGGFDTKWGELKKVWPGCIYSPLFFRTSENSIMNDNSKATGFDQINDEIIKSKIENYPDGPKSWEESFK